MSTLQDDDKFLVERATVSHSALASDLMSTIQDDDLMLVERGGVSYKITGEDVKDSLGPSEQAPDIASVLLTETNPVGSGRFTNNEFPYVTTMAVEGNPAPTFGAKARVFGATYDVAVKSDVITDVEETTVSEWNQDEVWSNSASSSNGWIQPPSTGFDGDLITGSSTAGGGEFTWDASSYGLTGRVRIYLYTAGAINQRLLKINNGPEIDLYNFGDNQTVWYDAGTISLNSIVVSTTTNGLGTGFNAIEVDGKILVDQGVAGAPTQEATELTFATDNNLDKFNNGADVKMTDAAGNDATYQPVTSQITGIQPILPLDDSTDKVDVDMTAQFAGITHITGFSVKNRSTDQTPSQYTTELHNLKVDGAFIKGTNVVVTEGEPYASSTWENFLTGDDVNAGGYNAQGQNNLDYSCTCDPIDIRGYSTITSWIGYGRFSVLDQNGNERFITGGSGSNLTLTLTDDTDLAYFRQGDVVQGVSTADVYDVRTTDDDVGYNSATPLHSDVYFGEQPSNDSVPATVHQIFDFKVPRTNIVFIRFAGSVQEGPSGWWRLYGSNNPNGGFILIDDVGEINGPVGDKPYDPLTSGNVPYRYLRLSRHIAYSVNYYGVDPDITNTSTKVISTDLDNNTMVVDGGYWSDGPITAPDSTNDVVVGSNVVSAHYNYSNSGGSAVSHGYFAYTNSNGDLDNTTITIKTGTAGTLKLSFAFTLANADKSSLPASGTNCTAAWTDDAASVDTGYGVYNLELTCTGAATYEFTLTDPPLTSPVIAYLYTGAMNSTSTPTWQGNTLYAPAGWSDAPNKLYVQSTLGDSKVTGPDLGATGKFGSANGNTATVTDVTGRWVANDNGKGEQFFMEPTAPQVDSSTEMYCIFDATGEVTSLSQSDPGFEPIPSKDYSVKFTDKLASGNAPDTDLPAGTSIEVTVKATNNVGSDEETSNAVTPEAPNPDGSAGPITLVSADGNTLTVASPSNLDTFTADDTVKMVDADGAVASYVPVTSQITGVEDVTVTVDEDSVTIEGNPYGPFDGNDSTFLAVSTSQTRTANVTLSTPVTGNLYVLGGNGTNDTNTSNLLTITNGGSSATQSFTSMTPTEYPLGAVTNWSTFRLYAGTGDRGGCYIYKFMIDRNDGKGKVDLIIKPGSLLTLTDDTDLKYFRPGDVVQAEYSDTTQLAWSTDQSTEPIWANYPNVVTYSRPDTVSQGSSWTFNILSSYIGDSIGIFWESSDNGATWSTTGGFLDNGHPTVIGTTADLMRIACYSGTDSQDYTATVDITEAQPPVKVISTDPDNNTMNVDGGKWDVSNQSQIWSSYAVSGDATGVFNGTLDYYSTNGVGFQVYDLQLQSAGLTASSSIEVMFESQTDFGNSVTINGINVIPFAVRQPANTWCDVTAEVGLGRIDTIIAATGGSSITAIVGFRIDGKLLIDAVNDSQVWSNYLTTGTGSWESSTPSGQDWSGAYKPSLAFNGKLTQSTMGYGDPCFSLSEGHYIYFEPQEPFTDVVSVEYYGDKSYARNIGINQESTAATTNPAAPTQDGSLSPFGEWVSVVNPPSTINRMWFKAWSGANGSTAVRGIKINGKLLVDAGVRDLGDTEVTGPTKSGVGTFVSTNLTDEIVVKDSNNQWIDNQNRLGTNFYVKEMNAFFKAGNARDEAEYQAIADAFAAYPGNVTARQTAISDLLADLAVVLSQEEMTLLYDLADMEEPGSGY